MNIFTDHIYEKGHSHSVCQDYALSQSYEDYSLFVISDGCGSAKNSEIGAMIMAHAFKASYNLIWHEGIDINKPDGEWHVNGKLRPIYDRKIMSPTLSKACDAEKNLELIPESLYATLVVGTYEKKTNTFSLWSHGDGLFVIMYKDMSYEIIEMEYENNAPYYMAYNYTPSTLESYIASCGGRSITTVYRYDKDGNYMNNSIFHKDYPASYSVKLKNDVICVLGFSDGIKSFKEHFTSLIPKCIDFKNLNKTFIQRRIKRLLKEKQQENDLHYDDLSVAGIILQ